MRMKVQGRLVPSLKSTKFSQKNKVGYFYNSDCDRDKDNDNFAGSDRQ